MDSENLTLILFQVILFFVSILFFVKFYLKKTETRLIKNQIDFMLTETLGDILKIGGKNPKLNQSIKELIDKLPGDIHENEKENESFNKSLMLLVLTGVVFLIGMYTYSKGKSGKFWKEFSLKNIIMESFVVLAFAILIKLFFLNNTVIAIDINKIKAELLTKLKDYLYTNE
jgi:hypothetical protein